MYLNLSLSYAVCVLYEMLICNFIEYALAILLHDFNLHIISLNPFTAEGFAKGEAGHPTWNFAFAVIKDFPLGDFIGDLLSAELVDI